MNRIIALLPIATAIALCELARPFSIPYPGIVMMVALMAVALIDSGLGLLLGTAFALGYIALTMSIPGHPFSYTPETGRRGLFFAVCLLAYSISARFLVHRTRTAERRLGHEALRWSEARFQALLKADIIGVFTHDSEGTIEQANDSFLSMLGYTTADFEERRLPGVEALTAPECRRLAELKRSELRERSFCRPWHTEVLTRTGTRVPVLIGASATGRGQYMCFCLNLTDVRKAERQLSSLSSRLLQMQDEDRRNIARQLHDTIAQNLAALAMNLSMVRSAGAGDRRTQDTIAHCSELTNECIADIRSLSCALHPPLLDELGLESALRNYLDGFTERTGCDARLELPAKLARLPHDIELGLFRITQERLAFLHRFAGEPRVTITLSDTDHQTELVISDDSAPVDPDHLDPDCESGIAIMALRERARQIDCDLEISPAAHGTTIRARIAKL